MCAQEDVAAEVEAVLCVERRMIFVTGDSINVTTRRFLEETGAASLGKPFGIDEIRRLVHAHPASIGEDAPDAPGTARS